jgi:hypothetical protein
MTSHHDDHPLNQAAEVFSDNRERLEREVYSDWLADAQEVGLRTDRMIAECDHHSDDPVAQLGRELLMAGAAQLRAQIRELQELFNDGS